MKIRNATNAVIIDQAISIFHERLPKVLTDLGNALPPHNHDFTYTDLMNISIINKLMVFYKKDDVLVVQPWNPWNPWTAALGYYSGGTNIYVNMRKLHSLSAAERAGNLAHEWTHFVGFGHGNNYPSPEKDRSVPYAIGHLVSGEKMYPLTKYPQVNRTVAMFV